MSPQSGPEYQGQQQSESSVPLQVYGAGEDALHAAPAAPMSDDRRAARNKALRVVVITSTLLLVIVAAFVLFVPAGFLEMRLSVLLKLGAGILATIFLSAGLMAASFYSDTTGHDDEAPGI